QPRRRARACAPPVTAPAAPAGPAGGAAHGGRERREEERGGPRDRAHRALHEVTERTERVALPRERDEVHREHDDERAEPARSRERERGPQGGPLGAGPCDEGRAHEGGHERDEHRGDEVGCAHAPASGSGRSSRARSSGVTRRVPTAYSTSRVRRLLASFPGPPRRPATPCLSSLSHTLSSLRLKRVMAQPSRAAASAFEGISLT